MIVSSPLKKEERVRNEKIHQTRIMKLAKDRDAAAKEASAAKDKLKKAEEAIRAATSAALDDEISIHTIMRWRGGKEG
jgi:hypothetical protein